MGNDNSGDETPQNAGILRHSPAAAHAGPIAHADIDRVIATLNAVLGAEPRIYHEIVSDRIHLDVLEYAPTADRPTWLLVTCGMSALPMTSPEGTGRFAELCLELPATWPIDEEAFRDERHYWPIHLMKTLARLPHDHQTWLGVGHTVPNHDPPALYADGTRLSGALLLPALALPEGQRTLPIPRSFASGGKPDERAQLLQIYPIYAAEMEHKLLYGLDSLVDKLKRSLDQFGLVVTPDRPDACAKAGWLRGFRFRRP
jgi:hypothetical protein